MTIDLIELYVHNHVKSQGQTMQQFCEEQLSDLLAENPHLSGASQEQLVAAASLRAAVQLCHALWQEPRH